MDKLELYHIHKINNHDSKWKLNRTIEIPTDFKNGMYERYQKFSTTKKTGDSEVQLEYMLAQYYNELQRGISPSKSELERILSYSYDVAFYGNMFKRETLLENYRLDKTPNLPSRLHSVYCTDEKGLPSWLMKLGSPLKNSEIYRVEAEGNIFKTSEYFLPDESLSYKDAYNEAYAYWNPNFRKVKDDANEYLVQGKIKILEKISG